MDADLKARWIAALRSGDYRQGQERLHTADDRFCCLGVLMDLLGAKQQLDALDNGDSESPAYEPARALIGPIHMQTLISLNDGFKHSFAQIADWIEAYL